MRTPEELYARYYELFNATMGKPHTREQSAVAALVAEEVAAEREACAKLCDEIAEEEEDNGRGDAGPLGCARAIRSRRPAPGEEA